MTNTTTTTTDMDLSPAKRAWITMRANAARLDDVEGNFQDCAGCGQPTKVPGPRGKTYHAICAEDAGVAFGRQATWGLI